MGLCNPLVQAKRWRREAEEGALADLPKVHSTKTLEPAWLEHLSAQSDSTVKRSAPEPATRTRSMSASSRRHFGPAALLLAATTIWPGAAMAEVVVVPSPYSYDSATLRQLDLGGTRGRYIGFLGHSVINWPAEAARLDAGNPGMIRCNNNNCWREGYIAPSLRGGTPAGSLRHYFNYQLDCRDQTFDRIGDVRLPGNYQRGWQPVLNDPVALAVAREWCPRISELMHAS
jgi:hypothetical protein